MLKVDCKYYRNLPVFMALGPFWDKKAFVRHKSLFSNCKKFQSFLVIRNLLKHLNNYNKFILTAHHIDWYAFSKTSKLLLNSEISIDLHFHRLN